MLLSLLLLLVLPILAVDADLQIIFDPPKDTVAFLNPEANITVMCDASWPLVHWIVNGTNLNELDNSSLFSTHNLSQSGINLCILYIPAKAKYNGTVVQCVATSGNDSSMNITSQNATILIQGILAPVSNLKVKSSKDSISISWTPPFSLNVTEVDLDLWYTLLICNVTDKKNPTSIFRNDSQNLVQPHYIFKTSNPSSSHKYTFTVIPINGAGQGEKSEPVMGAFKKSDAGISNPSCVLIILLGIVAYMYIS